jgi:hypothetical protein
MISKLTIISAGKWSGLIHQIIQFKGIACSLDRLRGRFTTIAKFRQAFVLIIVWLVANMASPSKFEPSVAVEVWESNVAVGMRVTPSQKPEIRAGWPRRAGAVSLVFYSVERFFMNDRSSTNQTFTKDS